jgi:chemotaxis protein histidine kinase CheA
MEWHGKTVPLVSLAHVLERQAQPASTTVRTVVVLAFEDHVVGFVVDQLEGEREVVVKRLDEFLGRVRNVAGATLLSSGDIVVVMHVPQLIASTMGISPTRLQARIRTQEEVAPRRRVRRLLVVDDSIIVRDMM